MIDVWYATYVTIMWHIQTKSYVLTSMVIDNMKQYIKTMEVQRKQEGPILLLNRLLLMSVGSHLCNNKTRWRALNDLSCSNMGATLCIPFKPLSQYHLQHISVQLETWWIHIVVLSHFYRYSHFCLEGHAMVFTHFNVENVTIPKLWSHFLWAKFEIKKQGVAWYQPKLVTIFYNMYDIEPIDRGLKSQSFNYKAQTWPPCYHG